MKAYYTLLVRESGRWAPEFGDYDKEVVEGERDDYADSHRASDLKIIRTDATQAAIDAAVAKKNGE